jgi:hypothetical protein
MIKSGDKIFIERSSIINAVNVVLDVQCVSSFEDKIFAKTLDKLWYDVTYFEYDKENNFWRDILPNNTTKEIVKYEGN